jgi:hypothetical protein
VFPKQQDQSERDDEKRSELFMAGVWSFSRNVPGPNFDEEKHLGLVRKLGANV